MRALTGPQSLGTLLCLVGALGCADGSGAPASGGEAAGAGAPAQAARSMEVRPGIEVLLTDSLHLVRDRAVGVVTNHTGLSVPGGSPPGTAPVHTIDRLAEHARVRLAAIYGPEHGYRGEAEAGEHVEGGRDGATGLPVHSLYGQTRKPTPEMLEGVEVLVFDIQDIGARYYTYVSTMALAMEAAGEAGIPFVVLDRPNPIGAPTQGNVLDPAYATFVGMYPIPMRHGMTPGELARLIAGEFGVEVTLHVVPAAGWRRDVPFGDTGLPWVAPSPNMPDTLSALHYPGTCLFEGTNLSVGRGTDRPFQQVGAPWLDGPALADRLNARGLPDVVFEPVAFTPRSPGDGKYGDTEVQGVRFRATGPTYDPTRAAVAALVEARALAGDTWEWRTAHFDRLAGTDGLRLGLDAGGEPGDLTADWDRQLAGFEALRAEYLIYR